MVTELVLSAQDTRAALHEAGEDAARRAIQNACRASQRDIALDSVTIEKDATGKPHGCIRGDGSRIAVSISHSFPYALAAAVTDGGMLGVDVEHIRDFAPHIWEAFLTPKEKKIIAKAPSAMQAYLRTLSWSFKESVLKALGTGLRMHPRSVDISRLLTNRSRNLVEINGVLYPVKKHCWRVSSNCIATTVAFSRPCRTIGVTT